MLNFTEYRSWGDIKSSQVCVWCLARVSRYLYRQCSSQLWSHTTLLNTLRPKQNGRHFTDDTFKRIFLNEMFEFRLKFHWSLFLRVQLTIFQQWFRWWLGAVQATSHYLNQWWLVYRRIYVSLGLNELNATRLRFRKHDSIDVYKWRSIST